MNKQKAPNDATNKEIISVSFSSFNFKTSKERLIVLESFDLNVFTAICKIARTQFENGQNEIEMTDEMILDTIIESGYCSDKPNKLKLLENISNSVQKMRNTFVSYIWSKQIVVSDKDKIDNKNGFSDVEYTFSERLLEIRATTTISEQQYPNRRYRLLSVPNICKCPPRVLRTFSIDESVIGLAKFADENNDPFEW